MKQQIDFSLLKKKKSVEGSAVSTEELVGLDLNQFLQPLAWWFRIKNLMSLNTNFINKMEKIVFILSDCCKVLCI